MNLINQLLLDPKTRFSYDPHSFNPNYNYTPSSNYANPYTAAEGFQINQSLNQPLSYGSQESSVTFRFFQELKNSKKFKTKLEQFDILSFSNVYSKFDYSRQFIFNGENYNINRLIENVKKFYFEESIPYILNYHFENFDKLNKIFIETLKVQMSSKIQEEIDAKLFKDEMFRTIHDSYLSFSTDNIFDFFAGQNKQYEGKEFRNFEWESKRLDFDRNKVNYDKNKGIKFCFFFGDSKKIKLLIEIIDAKLFLLMKNRLQEKQQGNISKFGHESNRVFYKSFELIFIREIILRDFSNFIFYFKFFVPLKND